MRSDRELAARGARADDGLRTAQLDYDELARHLTPPGVARSLSSRCRFASRGLRGVDPIWPERKSNFGERIAVASAEETCPAVLQSCSRDERPTSACAIRGSAPA